MEIKKIEFGDEGRAAMAALAARLPGFRDRAVGASPALAVHLDRTRRGLETLQALDRQQAGAGRIAVEGVDELVAAMLTDLAHVEAAAARSPDAAFLADTADFLLGVALWAIRREAVLDPVEPVVNALAHRANAARSKPALAAVFGLTQGILVHVAPRLAADLERSNPERPWRVLHANLAITAIRTEDPAMMDCAFDALDEALPDERAGFYAEALALALSPGVAPAVRERIEARHLKWTAAH
ncbi:MAG: hypothetical protein OEX21_02585 [Betaproteobacteria bacterium]|nr:hypothetical protein [Betaproteobacteria bacterium]